LNKTRRPEGSNILAATVQLVINGVTANPGGAYLLQQVKNAASEGEKQVGKISVGLVLGL